MWRAGAPKIMKTSLLPLDLFGWTFTNTRLLCDTYATGAEATVYMPDLFVVPLSPLSSTTLNMSSFGGQVIDPAIIANHNRWNEFDLAAWSKSNAKDARWGEIVSVVRALRDKYEKVGVIGYCYGGWSSFRLASIEFEPRLVDCISLSHEANLSSTTYAERMLITR